MFLIPPILLIVVLVCCWAVGDQEFKTKLIFTGLALLTFGACLIPVEIAQWINVAVQALLALVIGATTFGSRWGKR
jgi:hypothetical protein